MFKIWKWFKSQLQRVNGYIHQCPIQTKLHEKHHQRYCNVISPGFTVGRVLAFGYAEGFKPSGNSSPRLNPPKNTIKLFIFRRSYYWGVGTPGERKNMVRAFSEDFVQKITHEVVTQHTSQNKKNSLCCNRCFFIIVQSPSRSLQVSGQYVPATRHFGAIFDPQVEYLNLKLQHWVLHEYTIYMSCIFEINCWVKWNIWDQSFKWNI